MLIYGIYQCRQFRLVRYILVLGNYIAYSDLTGLIVKERYQCITHVECGGIFGSTRKKDSEYVGSAGILFEYTVEWRITCTCAKSVKYFGP